MSQLQVGNKVVCINNDGWVHRHGAPLSRNLPQYNGVYTVRAVHIDDYGMVGILLNELLNDPAPPYAEQGFKASCFRRVVERKTDTGFAILQALLTSKPVFQDQSYHTKPKPVEVAR